MEANLINLFLPIVNDFSVLPSALSARLSSSLRAGDSNTVTAIYRLFSETKKPCDGAVTFINISVRRHGY